MTADRLILLSKFLGSRFRDLARKEGRQGYPFRYFIDLQKTKYQLPVSLFCDGYKDHRHMIDIQGVARLGLSRTRELLTEIRAFPEHAEIYRIDWCVDIWDVSPWEVASTFLLLRARDCKMWREKGVTTFYPHFTRTREVRIYDRLTLMRKKRDPRAAMARRGDTLTRVEVQQNGQGVLHRNFRDKQKDSIETCSSEEFACG